MTKKRFLADENIPRKVVDLISEKGYDVLWIKKIAPRGSDDCILSMAEADGRIILTFDRDFGQLVYEKKLLTTQGIIYFRLDGLSPSKMAKAVIDALDSDTIFSGYFTVVTKTKIRQTPL
jgi:predicted nuclease of predicted toxin-antitoxin system